MKAFDLLSLTLLASAWTAAPVSAGGCGGCPGPCGRLENKSGRKMLYTTDPSLTASSKKGRCQFWNWYDTPLSPRQLAWCTQKELPDGKSLGGCREKIDIDAFTFPSQAYWAYGVKHNAGEWTKFPNTNTAVCRRVLGQNVCTWV